ncbi:WD40 repeat domain-containing serine/threonine protein kinase [Streptomyces sp. NBC_01803]|uniref:WD40 repeat domain-containing serine/threonine protein kinase n=1 Tax=Streptomyces sp. NBC_01803 TaxID=2975946 RepID=UPI002DD7DB20|nr:serine/threonine-protein kinase [Streptomyces sp. NBC_01803]WSA43004.1 serine/threonine-protein kinase [Streptomyces sp. NBC_01803]
MPDEVLAGRYRLVRQLGEGGMGQVWQAHDERLGRDVAVKLISVLAGGGSGGGEARARFLREARITARLQHPNIITVHDLGEAEGAEGATPFLVMELLRGRGLDAVLREGTVAPPDAARWGAQICDALAEAHAAGVLHRDVKPANILVAGSGPARTVKVLDFGIARAADSSVTGDRLTRTGFMVGTPQYMAPEQARGRPEPGSDLYALGCVLYEMITGRLPFTAPEAVGYLTAHLTETPPAPSAVSTGVPAGWDAVVLRLLRKDPGERYTSAAAVAEELRRLERRSAVPLVPGYTPTLLGGPARPDDGTDPDADTRTRLPSAPEPRGTPKTPGARRLRTFPVGRPVKVAFSPSGTQLLLTGDDGPLRVTDLTGREQLLGPPDSAVADQATAAFHPDGQHLAVAGRDRTLRFFDIADGRELRRVAQRATVGAPVFSPDGRLLATADADRVVRLRDPETGYPYSETIRRSDQPRGFWRGTPAFSPDGTRLAIGDGNKVRVYDVTGDHPAQILRIRISRAVAIPDLSFGPDGSTLATVRLSSLRGGGRVHLWNTRTGGRLLGLDTLRGVLSLAYGPRDMLATAGSDGTARILSALTGEELLRIDHPTSVTSVAFSPDGTLLAASAADATLQLWQLLG